MFTMLYHHDMQLTVLDRLLQIGDLFARDMDRAFTGTPLTPARVRLLWVLQHAAPSTQHDLATALEVSPRNVTGLVDALEAGGYVERTPHPTDRRATIVRLTTRAEVQMAEMQRDHAELTATLLAAVSPEDRDAFARGVNAVAQKLEEMVEEASRS